MRDLEQIMVCLDIYRFAGDVQDDGCIIILTGEGLTKARLYVVSNSPKMERKGSKYLGNNFLNHNCGEQDINKKVRLKCHQIRAVQRRHTQALSQK